MQTYHTLRVEAVFTKGSCCRSHLELEIFRQLQMRRQENGEGPGPASPSSPTSAASPTDLKACLPASNTTKQPFSQSIVPTHNFSGMDGQGLGKRTESEDEGNLPLDISPGAMQMTSSDDSPGSERALLRITSGEAEVRQAKMKPSRREGQRRNQKSRGNLPPPLDDSARISDLDPHLPRRHNADLEIAEAGYTSKKLGTDGLPHTALKAEGLLACGGPKHLLSDTAPIERSDSVRGSRRKAVNDLALVGMDRSDSLRVSGKKHIPDLPSIERSDSLRAGSRRLPAELAVSPMERSDSLRSAGKKPELPPKPTFAVVPVMDSRRSPKPPPLKIPTERLLYRADTGQSISAQPGGSGSVYRAEQGGSGQLGESSSGSEQDGLFSAGGMPSSGARRSQGQGRRNLRKTKSRGKGKGAGTLTPTLLLDELSFTVHEPPRDLEEVGDIVIETYPDA